MSATDAQAELQSLLIFLTREAKVPLAQAMPKYTALKKEGLTSPDAIAKADTGTLKSIFEDEKLVKQVQKAAQRLSNPRKRAAPATPLAASKHARAEADPEFHLRLPQTDLDISSIRVRSVETNRAPLFLAFAFGLSQYTLPNQPLSSRLSIAQAVTSAGAQSKAKYIGLTDTTAEDDGWAQGQPKVRLMGRDVAVMRRHIVVPQADAEQEDSQKTVDADHSTTSHEAFWGIDLEALKKSNGPLVAGKLASSTGPPVHKPEGARAYLLKSIDEAISDHASNKNESTTITEKPKSPAKIHKLTATEKGARREHAVAMLLKAIDHALGSWATTLSNDELDRRANSWYARVRPEVADGQAGWGQRGIVPLSAIVDLAKEP